MLNLSKFKWWMCLNDITFFFKSSTRVNTPINKHYVIAKHLTYLLCFLFFLLRFSWPWAPPIEVLQNLFNFIDIGSNQKEARRRQTCPKINKNHSPLFKPYICPFFFVHFEQFKKLWMRHLQNLFKLPMQ
jgi:hypothetical protein